MASSNERLVLATLSTSPTTLYTVPALKKAIATGLLICNTGATTRLVTILYAGKTILKYSLEAGETFALSVGEVLYTTEVITGSQAVGADVDIIISGVVEDV